MHNIDQIAANVAEQCLEQNEARGLLTRIGNLELRNDARLKEPQLRHLWTQAADKLGGFSYALECPTVGVYNFSSTKGTSRRGNIDLMLFAHDDEVGAGRTRTLVEFKHGWSTASLGGDFAKIYSESLVQEQADLGTLAGAVIMTVIEEVQNNGQIKAFKRFESALPTAARSAIAARLKVDNPVEGLRDCSTPFRLFAVVRSGSASGFYRLTNARTYSEFLASDSGVFEKLS